MLFKVFSLNIFDVVTCNPINITFPINVLAFLLLKLSVLILPTLWYWGKDLQFLVLLTSQL